MWDYMLTHYYHCRTILILRFQYNTAHHLASGHVCSLQCPGCNFLIHPVWWSCLNQQVEWHRCSYMEELIITKKYSYM